MAAGERLLDGRAQDVLRPDARVGDARLERIEHHGRRRGRRSCSRPPASVEGPARASSPPAPGRSACARRDCSPRRAPTCRSRRASRTAARSSSTSIQQRFGGTVKRSRDGRRVAGRRGVLEGAELLLNAGPAGVQLVPRDAWAGRTGLRVAADLNAVPPLGIEGIEVDRQRRRTATASKTFGALGVGGLKMKIHKACIARLFERNDLVLDAETIAEVARSCKRNRRLSNSAGQCRASSGSTPARSASTCAGSTTAASSSIESLPTAEALADSVGARRTCSRRAPLGAARSRRRAVRLRPAAHRRHATSPTTTSGWRISRPRARPGGIGGLGR